MQEPELEYIAEVVLVLRAGSFGTMSPDLIPRQVRETILDIVHENFIPSVDASVTQVTIFDSTGDHQVMGTVYSKSDGIPDLRFAERFQ